MKDNRNEKYRMYLSKEALSIRSEAYNFDFNPHTGFFARWGKTPKDDPAFSPFGPEILDLEISSGGDCLGNCPFCLPAGEKIATSSGSVNVEDIAIGDKVAAMDVSSEKPRLNEVKEIYERQYEGELIELTLENGQTLKLTPEHPVRTVDGRWVNAGELKEGDDVVYAD